jgi:hypothetical protein
VTPYNNALAESFVDTFKTEPIADKSLGDVPPAELATLYARQDQTITPSR